MVNVEVFIKLGYGTSEACSITSTQGDSFSDIKATALSTGKPLVGVEVKIVSIDGNLTSTFSFPFFSVAKVIIMK